MYGAGTELYEYLTELSEEKYEGNLQTTELTFTEAKPYARYINPKRQASSVGEKAQARGKARRKAGASKRVR